MSTRRQVMVVEDDGDNLESIVELLDSEGYDVVAARSGAEARALLETSRPCLILVDYLLPDITGNELIDLLRSQLGRIPIVVLTAMQPLSHPVDAPVLNKPVAVDDLLGTLRRYCPSNDTPRPVYP